MEPGFYTYKSINSDTTIIAVVLKKPDPIADCVCVYPSGAAIHCGVSEMGGEWGEKIEFKQKDKVVYDLISHIYRQREFSLKTFGNQTTLGVADHCRKELGEIDDNPNDLHEWIDLILLSIDGACRSGANPEKIIEALEAKQTKNEAREWPDWRTLPADKAIEHNKTVRKPAEVFHPGVHLLDELDARHLDLWDFSLKIGYGRNFIEYICKGNQDINPEIAERLSKALGMSAEYWLSLQRAWDERER
jgi:plasmid maintenance system antidote protein VapI